MDFKNSKVAIVGIGNVGATTAYSIISQGLCAEVVLIDVNKKKPMPKRWTYNNPFIF